MMPLPWALLAAVVHAAPPLPFTCTAAALSGAHPSTLRLYRNAVFARHGRPFSAPELQAAFAALPGYQPDPAYSDARLEPADRACLARVQALEAAGEASQEVLLKPDLDGDGAGEEVRWDGRSLSVGKAQLELGGGGEPAAPVLIDLDLSDGLQELVVVTDPGVEDEQQVQVVRYQGGRLLPLLEKPVWMDHQHYTVEHRSLRLVARNCGQETTTRWTLEGATLRQTQTAAGDYDPKQCAACPLVLRVDGARPGLQGEILRELRSPELERWDLLDIGSVTPGVVTVRLLELKPETTLLDAVHLEVDGRRLAPEGCPGPAHCTEDGDPLRLGTGEALDLRFVVPGGGEATLRAVGHYRPHLPVADGAGGVVLVPAP